MKRFTPFAIFLLLPALVFAQDGTAANPVYEYVTPLVLMFLSLGLGWIAKQIPAFPDEWIPFLTPICGALLGLIDSVLLGGWLTGLAGDNAGLAALLGAVAGAISTWTHQLVKQQTKT